MDELRRVAQALLDKEEERKEIERKAQAASPAKPGPLQPEQPPPPVQPNVHPVGQPRSFEPLRTEGTVPATLEGSPVPTWLRLPKDRWPKGWKGKCNDPLVPMLLALYGHPDSGGIWET